MPLLIGGVVLAVALTLLNLVLMIGVIRRLREHTGLLSARGDTADILLGVGETPDDFTAATTDGGHVSRETLIGEQLVGFLSPGCGPCTEILPRFVERAAVAGRANALAVFALGSEDADGLVAQLEPVARVVVERDDDSVSRAFKVRGFPALCLLNADKVVTASGTDVLRVTEALSEAV